MSSSNWDRLADFRQLYRPGQLIFGRVISQLGPSLALLNFNGIRLSAAMSQVPDPGATRVFRIQALSPTIVLQEVTPACSPVGADTARPLHPAEQVARLRTARDTLEGHLATAGLWPGAGLEDGQSAQEAFLGALAKTPAAAKAYADLTALLASTGNMPGQAVAEYHPWLTPAAQGFELITLDTDPIRRVCTFHDPSAGAVELTLLAGETKASYRALAATQDVPASCLDTLAAALLADLREDTAGSVQCLGTGRLKRQSGAFALLLEDPIPGAGPASLLENPYYTT